MKSYEIWWNDLTISAKARLFLLHHENIDLSPIAIIDIEDEEEDDLQLKLDLWKKLKK